MANPLKGKTIIVTAGGTGGHMFPALAMIQKLQEQGAEIHLITDDRGMQYLPSASGFSTHILPLAGLGKPRKIDRLLGFVTLIPSFAVCLYALYTLKPLRVIGFGGYPSFPCLLASCLLRIPFWLQEQNAHIGRVNKCFASAAEGVALGFAETTGVTPALRHKTFVIGIPVRQQIYSARRYKYRPGSERFKILVLGGSQGARVFSDVLPQAFDLLSAEERASLSIVQQCRAEDCQRVAQLYAQKGIQHIVQPFITCVDQELEDTALIIARSGASTTGEVIASARPALFVPLPVAMDDHQYFNAQAVVRQAGGWALRETQFSPERVFRFIRSLLQDPSVLLRAHGALASSVERQATDQLCRLIQGRIAPTPDYS